MQPWFCQGRKMTFQLLRGMQATLRAMQVLLLALSGVWVLDCPSPGLRTSPVMCDPFPIHSWHGKVTVVTLPVLLGCCQHRGAAVAFLCMPGEMSCRKDIWKESCGRAFSWDEGGEGTTSA